MVDWKEIQQQLQQLAFDSGHIGPTGSHKHIQQKIAHTLSQVLLSLESLNGGPLKSSEWYHPDSIREWARKVDNHIPEDPRVDEELTHIEMMIHLNSLREGPDRRSEQLEAFDEELEFLKQLDREEEAKLEREFPLEPPTENQ